MQKFLTRIYRIKANNKRRAMSLRAFALAGRSNLIFNFSFLSCFVFSLLTSYFLLLISISFAQTTYNLEIIFQRTNWNPDTIRSYSNALSSAGDVNQDRFDDIVYSVFFDDWYGYVFYGGPAMDTFPDLISTNEITSQTGLAVLSGIAVFEVNGIGGGPQGSEMTMPSQFLFEPIYPNPINKIMKLKINLPDDRAARIEMYDVTGRLVKILVDDIAKKGENEFIVIMNDLPAGIYFVKVKTEDHQAVQKAVLLR